MLLSFATKPFDRRTECANHEGSRSCLRVPRLDSRPDHDRNCSAPMILVPSGRRGHGAARHGFGRSPWWLGRSHHLFYASAGNRSPRHRRAFGGGRTRRHIPRSGGENHPEVRCEGQSETIGRKAAERAGSTRAQAIQARAPCSPSGRAPEETCLCAGGRSRHCGHRSRTAAPADGKMTSPSESQEAPSSERRKEMRSEASRPSARSPTRT